MSITFECEECHRQYQAAEGLAGKRSRCRQCGHIFRIPMAGGPTTVDIYGLEDGGLPNAPVEAPLRGSQPPSSRAARNPGNRYVSGLPGLSALSLRGFNVYCAGILALLLVSLWFSGTTRLILATVGGFLCVGPFIAAGFNRRWGVAFRDGLVPGLLYMFFIPYRIHYRLKHKKRFQALGVRPLTLRDFSLLLLGLGFLPVVILAAQEMDLQPRKRPPQVNWARLAKGPGKFIPALPDKPKHHADPPPLGIGRAGRPRRHAAVAGAPHAEAGVPRNAVHDHEAPAGPSPRVTEADAWPPSPRPSSPGPLRSRSGQTPRSPFSPGGPVRGASPTSDPETTITITVQAAAGSQSAPKQWNQAVIAILKASGGRWHVGFSTIGDKTIFRVGPVDDPKAFADKIEFGKVTRVQGRSIDVEAGH